MVKRSIKTEITDLARYYNPNFNSVEFDLIKTKYRHFKGIEQEKLVQFEHSFDEEIKKLAAVGNEHSPAFRLIVAQQFIYQYENSLQEAEIVEK